MDERGMRWISDGLEAMGRSLEGEGRLAHYISTL